MKPKKIDPESLGKSLAEYGSLDKAIEAKKAQLATLQPQVEQLQGIKARLTPELEALLIQRSDLMQETKELGELKQDLSQSIGVLRNRKNMLESCLLPLEGVSSALEAKKAGLEEENRQLEEKIQEKEEKLKVVPALDKEIEGKTKSLQDLERRKSEAGARYQLFEGFAGFVAATTGQEIEKFLVTLPDLIEDTRKGEYDPDFLKKHIIRKLTWNSLDVMACSDCGVEFVVIRRTQVRSSGYYRLYDGGLRHCPVCGMTIWVECKNELARMLEEELKPKVQPTRFVVVKAPTKGIVEQHNSPDMKASP